MKSKKLSPQTLTTLITIAFSCAFILLEHFISHYKDIDNYLISNIVNCLYSEQENYVLFIHPFFCEIIKFFHKIYPYADWFLVLTEVAVVMSYGFLSIGFNTYHNYDYKKSIGTSLVLFMFFVSSDLVHVNFTIPTMAIAVAAITLFVLYVITSRKLLFGFSVTLYIISWLFRTDSGELFIPFAGLIFIYLLAKSIKERNQISKKQTLTGVAFFIIVVLIMICSKEIYTSGKGYKEGAAYNEARAQIADYSKGGSIIYHFLMDTENVNTEYLNDQYKSFYSKHTKEQALIPSLLNMPQRLLQLKYDPTFYVPAFILALFVLVFSKGFLARVAVILDILGAELIFAYFTHVGRIPERVMCAIYLGMLSVTLACFLVERRERKKIEGILLTISMTAFVLLCIYLTPRHVKFTSLHNAFTAAKDNDIAISSELSEGNTYIWSVSLFNENIAYKKYWHYGKIYPQNLVIKNLPDGDWFYGQPYFEEFLEKIGLQNPMKALFTEDNIYYIAEPEYAEIIKYYYDINDEYDIEVAGYIGENPINKYVKKNK